MCCKNTHKLHAHTISARVIIKMHFSENCLLLIMKKTHECLSRHCTMSILIIQFLIIYLSVFWKLNYVWILFFCNDGLNRECLPYTLSFLIISVGEIAHFLSLTNDFLSLHRWYFFARSRASFSINICRILCERANIFNCNVKKKWKKLLKTQ
jgi:hypothetical protein